MDDERMSDSTLFDLVPEPPRRQARRPTVSPPLEPLGKPATLNYGRPNGNGRPSGAVETVRDLYLPAWLLGGGVVAELLAAVLFHGGVGSTAVGLVVNLLVGVPVMLAATLLAAKLRGIRLGPTAVVLLKLAALFVAPAAAVDLCGGFLHFLPFIGAAIGWGIEFVAFFALLGALFDLDESDTWFVLGVIVLVRLAFVVGVALLVRR